MIRQIGGAERDAGMHLVHMSEAGELLVVGVIYDVTAEGHNVAVSEKQTFRVDLSAMLQRTFVICRTIWPAIYR